jgi:DNA mismatch repair ATPase MutS
MHPDRDFDLGQDLPAHADTLMRDLELDTLLAAMAEGDGFLCDVAKRALLSALHGDPETILYRQAVLRDCLRQRATVERIYAIAVETLENKRKMWLSLFGLGSSPSSMVRGAVDLLAMLVDALAQLRALVDEHAENFESRGFHTLFSLFKAELGGTYLARVRADLEDLRFSRGVLLSAQLGPGNQATGYVLRKAPGGKPSWLGRILDRTAAYSFRLSERDDLGARTLGEMQNAAMARIAGCLAESADTALRLFVALRTELAFYLGGANLHRRLVAKGVPVCFPTPFAPGMRQHTGTGLCDACLALTTGETVVDNDLHSNGRDLVVITGANQGGKSTFLRAVGVAQLMMQAGLFVTAEVFSAEVCRGIFTHYQREEDADLEHGRFDEEIARLSAIVDALVPDSLLLLNESFAATNEREGSQVGGQIIRGLVAERVRIFFVTHLYELAHGLFGDQSVAGLFLRAERHAGGGRSFKVPPGEPLPTSFGADLFDTIFVRSLPAGKLGSANNSLA